MDKFKVTLTIVLEVTAEQIIGPDVLAAAHCRAEQFAARVFLCGDKGGKMTIQDGESTDGAGKVEASAKSIVRLPGTMRVSRVRTTTRKGRKASAKG